MICKPFFQQGLSNVARDPRGKRAALAALVLTAFALPASASAAFAPIDLPGPPIPLSSAVLASTVRCHGNLRDPSHEPVLLTPATTVTSDQDFGANLERSLTATGFPWCTSDQPGSLASNMDDIQVRGYYVTYAIRHVYALAGNRPIAVMGHSQGGMIMRLALRFWPDTRKMVDDVIGIAGSNHGSTAISSQCAAGCSAAFRQQAAGSTFEQALNSSGQETFPGISYTEISTDTDEVVTPNGVNGVSSVHGPGQITNVAVQQICPTDLTHEHLQLAGDPVTWALAYDALTHPGPADPARINRSVCSAAFAPGQDPATFLTDQTASLAALATAIATYPQAPAEPPPKCWTHGTCTGADAPTLQLLNHHTINRRTHTIRIRFQVRTQEGDALVPVGGVTIRIGRYQTSTSPTGTAAITLPYRAGRTQQATASRPGCNTASEPVAT